MAFGARTFTTNVITLSVSPGDLVAALVLGALLFTCLCLLSLNIAADAMFAPLKPVKPGFEVAVQEHPEILLEVAEQAQLAVEVELRREEEVQAAPSAG